MTIIWQKLMYQIGIRNKSVDGKLLLDKCSHVRMLFKRVYQWSNALVIINYLCYFEKSETNSSKNGFITLNGK